MLIGDWSSHPEKLRRPKRIALVGFAWGAWQTLSATERGTIERAAEHKFGAAAAFYPACDSFKGVMTVPTLIVIGERDDWASADACRKFAAGEDDMGISRQRGKGAPFSSLFFRMRPTGLTFRRFRRRFNIGVVTWRSINRPLSTRAKHSANFFDRPSGRGRSGPSGLRATWDFHWCRLRGLNSRPSVYKTAALPLS